MELQCLDVPVSHRVHVLVRLITYHVVHKQDVSWRARDRREKGTARNFLMVVSSLSLQHLQYRVSGSSHLVAREEVFVTVVGPLNKGVGGITILYVGDTDDDLCCDMDMNLDTVCTVAMTTEPCSSSSTHGSFTPFAPFSTARFKMR